MKARKSSSQRETRTSPQHDISAEQACNIVRQARVGVRTVRALLRGTQPTVQHLHALLRNRELSKRTAAQLGKETEQLASLTQQLATLTHSFTNTVQNFLLEVTLKQDNEQLRIPAGKPRSLGTDDHHTSA